MLKLEINILVLLAVLPLSVPRALSGLGIIKENVPELEPKISPWMTYLLLFLCHLLSLKHLAMNSLLFPWSHR